MLPSPARCCSAASPGISGIVGGLLRPEKGDFGWRLAFVAGLLGAPFIHSMVTTLPALQIDAGVPVLAVQ